MYQRESDGRWVGVVDLGWVGGKRVRKTVTAPTLRELRPKFKRLQQQIDSGVLPDEASVEQWMTHWLDTIAAKEVRPSTLRTYRGYTTGWIIPHLGNRRLDKLRPEHIRALHQAMEDAGRSDATRRQVHAILQRALKVAEREDRLLSNPATKVQAPKVGTGTHGWLELAEAHKVLGVLDSPGVEGSRWVVALLAGLRQGEALGLTWENVDLEDRVIYVRQAAQRIPRKGIVLGPPKSKTAIRAVPMVMPVYRALSAMPSREGFVWGGEKPRDPRADWQAWVDLLALAGVDRKPLHAARATTASLLDEAGVSETTIKEIMGHAQVMTTQRHYLKSGATRHREAMAALDALLELP